MLPPEVWSRIFTCCLPKDQFLEPEPLRAPLLVTQICRLWREIATSTPQLWTSLCVIEGDAHCIQTSQSRALQIDLWLSRSGNLPIYIYLEISNKVEFFRIFLNAIKPYTGRCRQISFSILSSQIEYLVNDPALSWSMLQNLVAHIRWYDVDVDKVIFSLSPSAVSLRYLEIREPPALESVPHLELHRFRLVWASLTYFKTTAYLSVMIMEAESLAAVKKIIEEDIYYTSGVVSNSFYSHTTFLSCYVSAVGSRETCHLTVYRRQRVSLA